MMDEGNLGLACGIPITVVSGACVIAGSLAAIPFLLLGGAGIAIGIKELLN